MIWTSNAPWLALIMRNLSDIRGRNLLLGADLSALRPHVFRTAVPAFLGILLVPGLAFAADGYAREHQVGFRKFSHIFTPN